MRSKRSDGVLVLGTMAIVFGIWSLVHYLSSSYMFLKQPHLYFQMLHSKGGTLAQLTYFGSISSLVIYPLFIVSGFAVLKLRNWGRSLLIVISVVGLIISLILPYIWADIMSGDSHRAMVIPTPIPILYVINIWFFNRKNVRGQFEQ